jgi:hypothetical protein
LEDNVKWMLRKEDVRMFIGFIWLRIGSSEGLVKTAMNLRFHKTRGQEFLD